MVTQNPVRYNIFQQVCGRCVVLVVFFVQKEAQIMS